MENEIKVGCAKCIALKEDHTEEHKVIIIDKLRKTGCYKGYGMEICPSTLAKEDLLPPKVDNTKLMRLLDLLEMYNQVGVLRQEFEAFTGNDEPIETIDDLISTMEEEMSCWEPA